MKNDLSKFAREDYADYEDYEFARGSSLHITFGCLIFFPNIDFISSLIFSRSTQVDSGFVTLPDRKRTLLTCKGILQTVNNLRRQLSHQHANAAHDDDDDWGLRAPMRPSNHVS